MRGTLDIYRGIADITFIGVVSHGGFLGKLRVVVSSSCEVERVTALVVLKVAQGSELFVLMMKRRVARARDEFQFASVLLRSQ